MALVAEQVEEALLVRGKAVSFEALEAREIVGRRFHGGVHVACVHGPAAAEFGEAVFDGAHGFAHLEFKVLE